VGYVNKKTPSKVSGLGRLGRYPKGNGTQVQEKEDFRGRGLPSPKSYFFSDTLGLIGFTPASG
jgi:hypothetical protein